MGDLPGSPSVAPSPLFCTAPWRGREGAAAGFARCPGSPGSVVNTAGGRKRRRTEVVSTPLYAAPPVAAELTPFSRLLPFLFSCFPPALFSLLLPGERSCSGGPSCGMRHRPEKSQIHRAPCSAAGRREQTRGFGSSAPSGVPPPRPGGVHCRGGGGVILAGAIIPTSMHQIPSELCS
jgi:hypothetical protein